MNRLRVLLLAMLGCSLAYAQTTITIPSQTIQVVIPAQTVTLPANPTSPPVTPPPPPPVSSSTSWVYYNGALVWAGDMSWDATPNYLDTTGAPLSGKYDVLVNVTSGTTGGWQPYYNIGCQQAITSCFNLTPYKTLIFSLKPTAANSVWNVAFLSSGDTPDGAAVSDISQYCSGGHNPAIGVWESCAIPLSKFALTDLEILKFFIQANAPMGTNFYADNVGFQ